MDFAEIITGHQQAQQSALAARSAKQESERLRRELNARSVEEHLRTVVEPVLRSAEEQIRSKSLAATVKAVMSCDRTEAGKGPEFALEFVLTTGRDGQLNRSLEFCGDSGSATVRTIMRMDSATGPEAGAERRLENVTVEWVEECVATFLRRVFPAR